MGTTTKMAIPYPEATGLVKDGWEDMKDIATQVDAKSGLVLLNTTTFSAVSSQSINDVFSSNFTNYRIVSEIVGDAFRTVFLRWRVSGADDTNANYAYVNNSANGSTVTTSRSTGGTNVIFTYVDSGGRACNFHDVSNPFATQKTTYVGHSNLFSSTALEYYGLVHVYNATTSFTGFSLIPSAGNITGSVRVYGYNQ